MERSIQDRFERDDTDIRNERSHNKTFHPTVDSVGGLLEAIYPATERPPYHRF